MPADAAAPVVMRSSSPSSACHTVQSIFARAERVFERRVDQLLQAKRHKALQAGTPFNTRKAKRDARTVAGREKLDALVRRLADLAAVQEAVLGEDGSKKVASVLDGATAVLMGLSALTLAQEKDAECLETSSCSDDCSVSDPKVKDSDPPDLSLHSDRHLFPATESVVNFVLACDDDDTHPNRAKASPAVVPDNRMVHNKHPNAYHVNWKPPSRDSHPPSM